MFAAGMIGGRTGKSSMETVKMSFGEFGGKFFSLLNVTYQYKIKKKDAGIRYQGLAYVSPFVKYRSIHLYIFQTGVF